MNGTARLAWLPSFLLVVLAMGCLASLQSLYDGASRSLHESEKAAAITYHDPLVPTAPALEALSLSDRQLVADILWLQTIQYFGSGNPYGKYNALAPMLSTITQVDPRFEYPYEFALISLPFMGAADTAAKMGEQAQQAIPGNGLLTFYLASTYQINLKDYRKAAFYYQKAVTEPGAPAAAQELAGVSLAKLNGSLNDRQVAALFWKTVYDQAKDPDEKERAKNWFEQMEIVYQLEQQAQLFKDRSGRYPASLQELVDQHYLSSIPDSPIGRIFDYNPSTGKVSFDRLKR